MPSPFLPFFVVGGTELFFASLAPAWAAWFLYWAGGASVWVGAAYVLRRPALLGKLGAPTLATLALLPFLVTARGAARVGRRTMTAWKVELVPGLWVGGWPHGGVPDLAQLDLTAELPRRGESLRYRAVPMLDGAPPNLPEWTTAVEQAVAWRREGLPVLVHCAYGHGRSVAVCIGVLVAEGHDPTWEAAHARILAVRPRARMTDAQRRMLAAAIVTLPGRAAG